mmetsp:Transcript_47339/g.135748  ORF Transcript_47339/g.135748 Transcript_47339/m.135748 type:complete len:412 (-) Transcript_47339:254-1489(-)
MGLVAPPCDGRQPTLKPLQARELVLAASAVTAVFGAALLGLHHWAESSGVKEAVSDTVPGFWGTLPSAWDHPEPNYLVSNGIGEFWSVLTTVPIAGTLLTYQGFKYQYSAKILRIYLLTCGMYSLAFTAHLTLQKVVFSTTVTAVMTNALLTFAEFSPVVHRLLESVALRGSIVFAAEALLIFTVATLPYALPANGGVWTLFIVQAPGVFLATAFAAVLTWTAKRRQEKDTYSLVMLAGSLLSSAMVLSYIECNIGFEIASSDFWGFPWIHIAIHVLEQMGIYIFGVGVAALHEMLLMKPPREGAEVRWIGYCVPFLHCPHAPGVELLDAGNDASPVSAAASEATSVLGQVSDSSTEEQRGGPIERQRSQSQLSEGSPKSDGHPTLSRRRRDKTPGAIAPMKQAEPQEPPH